MAFFEKRLRKLLKKKLDKNCDIIYNIRDIFVITTNVSTPFKNDENFGIPKRIVEICFLARKKGNEYFELFSDEKFEKFESTFVSASKPKLNITNVDPIWRYLNGPPDQHLLKTRYQPDQYFITTSELFNFIIDLNLRIYASQFQK